MSEKRDYLIATFFDFNGRHIEVQVCDDGFSYWSDESAARKVWHKAGGSGIDILLGDEKSARDRQHIYDEHTIKVPVPEAGMLVIRDSLSQKYWTDTDDRQDDKKLDEILEPLFWEYVNPYLSPPCTRG